MLNYLSPNLFLLTHPRFLASIVGILLFQSIAYPVGIKDLDPENEDVVVILNYTIDFMRYDQPDENRMYVSMKENETLHFGMRFSVSGNGNPQTIIDDNVFVRIKDENGNIVYGPIEIKNGEQGYIQDRASCDFGPQQVNGAGGYDALNFNAPYDSDFYVEVNYADPNNYNPSFPFQSRDLHSFCLNLFDFTIVDDQNKEQKGRVWAKTWQVRCMQGWNHGIYAKQYIYTDDGLISYLDYNGLDPYHYLLVSNDHGVTNTGDFVEDRKSQATNDISKLAQYKLFFDQPDTSIFELADLDLLFGDLKSPISVSGCPGDYCINIDVNKESRANLLLDLNSTVGYQENTEDIILEVELKEGENCVSWDGIDGLGGNINKANIEIDIEFVAGITHLPMYDVEYNRNGINVIYVLPEDLAGHTDIYYDDSNIGGNTRIQNGCPTNCHTWTDYNFGDEKIVNSWWYISKEPIKSVIALTPRSIDAGTDIDICLSDSTQLSPTSGLASYKWSPEDLVSNPNIATPYTFGIREEYLKLTATTDDGCTFEDSLKITMKTQPNITASAPAMCPEDNTKLNANGGVSYVWDNNLGTGNNLTVSPTASTTYQVIGTASNGCRDTATVEVTVYPSPSVTAATTPICQGKTATLTASGASTYNWSNSLGFGDEVSTTANSTSSFTVTGTDDNGCTATANVTLTVYPTPTISVNSERICTGESTTIKASGGTSYLWQDNSTNENLTVSPASTNVYSVVGTDNNGCSASAFGVVEVFDNPTVSLISDKNTICIGEIVNLTASGAINYTWNKSTNVSSRISVTPSVETEYIVIGEKLGCTDTSKIIINVNDLPEIFASTAAICTGESAVLHAEGGSTYNWDNLGNGNDIIVTPTSTSTYYVSGTDENGCTGEAEVEVFVKSLPEIDGYVDMGGEDKILSGEQVSLVPVTNATSIQLEQMPTGTLMYAGPTQTVYLVPDSTSNYLLTGMKDECADSANLEVEVVELIKVPSMITPNGDGLNDNWIIEHIEDFPEAEVSLYNRWGNVVFRTYDYDDSFEGRSQGEDLPAAVYYYVIRLNFREYIYKGSLTIMR